MEALTVAQQCVCRSKQFENPTRFRRDIQEHPKLPSFGDIFGLKCARQLQKSSFPINVKIGADHPEDTKRRSISVSLPNSSPIKKHDKKKRFLHIKQVVMKAVALLRCPAQFCEIRSEILTSYLN